MPLPQKQYCTADDYWNLPDGQRAELIDGELYFMAPPDFLHQKLVSEFTQCIGQYIKAHKGTCEVIPAPFAIHLDDGNTNWVEPDISVICDKNKLEDRGCNGAPDWIIEIVSPGNPEHDYVRKLNLYLDAGVREYWIVDPRDRKILVYYLKNEHTEDFTVKPYTFQDKIKVNIYDDLWIDFQEMNL